MEIENQIDLAKRNPDAEISRDALGALREVDTDSGTAVFDISTKSLDLHKSCVNTKGIDYQSRYFGKNPIVLFNHDYDRPIAKSEWIRIMENGALRAKCVYGKTNLAQEILSLVKDEILRSASIGFISKEQYFDMEAARAYKEDYGEECPDGMNWYIRKSMLLEWSNVSVGSNGDALVSKMGTLSPQLRQMIIAEQLSESMPKLMSDYKRISEELAKVVSENTSLSERAKILENKISDLESNVKAGAVQSKKMEPVGTIKNVITEKDIENVFKRELEKQIKYSTGQV